MFRLRFGHFLLCFIIAIVSIASTFTWTPWRFYHKRAANLSTRKTQDEQVKLISHQAAYDPAVAIPAVETVWMHSNGTPFSYDTWLSNPPEPNARSRLRKYGARVACWPSTGGVWIKDAELVDLDFLGLSRIRDTPRQSDTAAAEDKFCTTLKMLGADWWSLPPRLEQKRKGREIGGLGENGCDTLETCFKPDFENRFLLAWPEDQMVVCYVAKAQAEEKGGREFLGGWYHSTGMFGRCGIINSLGGKRCYC
ncbi:MAG: hypothetical protein EOO38_28640, partial [Cytophagaceae bacterium]